MTKSGGYFQEKNNCVWMLETTWWNSFFCDFLLTALHDISSTTHFMYKSWTETFALHEQGCFLRQYCEFLSFLAFLFCQCLFTVLAASSGNNETGDFIVGFPQKNSYFRDFRQCKKKEKKFKYTECKANDEKKFPFIVTFERYFEI